MVIQRILICSTRSANKTSLVPKLINFKKYQQTFRLFNTSSPLCTERWYTDKHEWVRIEGNVGTVGISSYAQEALGDVVYAQLPEVGTELSKGDECGALESVKAASEIYSPVAGKVTEKNTLVEETPSLINTSCFDKGWLFKAELKDVEGVKKLMSEEKYKEFLKTAEDH